MIAPNNRRHAYTRQVRAMQDIYTLQVYTGTCMILHVLTSTGTVTHVSVEYRRYLISFYQL